MSIDLVPGYEANLKGLYADVRARLRAGSYEAARRPERRFLVKDIEDMGPIDPPVNFIGLPSWKRIVALVAAKHRVSPRDIVGPLQTNKVVAARDEAIRLVRTHCRLLSLKQIGKKFGDRDHTTILHSLRKTERARK